MRLLLVVKLLVLESIAVCSNVVAQNHFCDPELGWISQTMMRIIGKAGLTTPRSEKKLAILIKMI